MVPGARRAGQEHLGSLWRIGAVGKTHDAMVLDCRFYYWVDRFSVIHSLRFLLSPPARCFL